MTDLWKRIATAWREFVADVKEARLRARLRTGLQGYGDRLAKDIERGRR